MRSETRRVRFTKTAINQIAPPSRDREVWHDTEMRGLICIVWSSGRKTFYHYGKIDGKPERYRLGEWPTMTVEQARSAAAVHVGRCEDGQNPAAAKREGANAPTLKALFEDFIAAPTRTKAKRPRSEVTAKNYRYLFAEHLGDWHDRQVSRIGRAEIEALHNRIGTDRPYLANRVLSLLKAILEYAVEHRHLRDNPAQRLRPFEEHQRERFLRSDELPAFFAAVEAEPSEKIRDFIKVALFTGARKGNVLEMRWSDLNLAERIWTIPKTKAGKPQVVPLAEPVVEILARRAAAKTGSDFVFPGRHGNEHLVDPMRQWRDVLARAGIAHLRIHDLRRTLGSWQAATGSSLNLIGKSLGHARPETTAIYARLELQPVRDAVGQAVSAIQSAARKTGEVEGANDGKAS